MSGDLQLGYLGFQVADRDAWHRFLTEVVGLVDAGEGRYRNDGHAWRIALTDGPADDLDVVAWEVDTGDAPAVLARLAAAGVAVTEADAEVIGAAARWRFLDPAGIPTELVVGLPRGEAPFRSPVVPGGFVADALGLGHLVLASPEKAASVAFYTDVLGARLSDHIVTSFHGHSVDLTFLHTNARHHSVAFGGPQKKRLHHVMFEVHTVDEVGAAFDRCLRAGVRVFQTIGRHPNDQMISFYAFTPSGFQFEFGCAGRLVDDATWAPTTYDRISDWGHVPVGLLAPARRP